MDDTPLSTTDRTERTPPTLRTDSARRIRVFVSAVYYVVVGAFVVFALITMVRQIWVRPTTMWPVEQCRTGMLELVRAVERARAAAGTSPGDDEAVALHRFRNALLPEWQSYDAIAATCGKHTSWAPSLDLIQRLRYAEERATRRDAVELSPLRRRVDELVATRLQVDRASPHSDR